MPAKADILSQLKSDILSLQGFKPLAANEQMEVGLGRINQSFPNGIFPLAALHEFFCSGQEETSAAAAFVSGLLSSLMKKGGAVLWIGTARKVFPPALQWFGIEPGQVIFLDLKKEKEVSWAVEEALQCKALTAVVSEMQEMSFTASRRFQLAIEQSGVACFVLRHQPKKQITTAVTRWQIKPLQSRTEDDLPGVGHPHWQVHLLKARNGKPGSWEVEWVAGRFHLVSKLALVERAGQRKTG